MNFLAQIRRIKNNLFFKKSSQKTLYNSNNTIHLVKSTRGKGFFAVMNGILGGIQEVDKGNLSGIEFKFTDGLYADKKGDNWLFNYFTFKNLPVVKENNVIKVFDDIPFAFHILPRKTDRKENFRIFQKYIDIHPDILAEADAVSTGFTRIYTIGIHYRGTDKVTEATPATYEEVLEHVIRETEQIGGTEFQIYVATDEYVFIEFMQQKFGSRIKYLEYAERSVDGRPVHLDQKTAKLPSELGREALIDALVLSRTALLIRTSSNLSLWSTFFNPDLRVLLVNNRFGSTAE